MFKIITALSDIIVIFFDLLLYARLTVLKRDTVWMRILTYAVIAVILGGYFTATYVFELPAALSSFALMSLPSLLFFWLVSKHKGARFFVTFCFVDTVSLALAFFARAAGVYGGTAGAVIGCLVLLVVFTSIYVIGRPYFSRYRQLLDSVSGNWGLMMLATILIYVLMVFVAAYPYPMAQRPEYLPVYGMVSLTVLSFYAVFISTLFQKKRLDDANYQLIAEKRWHRIAYVDALTGIKNRIAYVERINALSADDALHNQTVFALMFDLDGFKSINDNFGHHTGDVMLKQAAAALSAVFADESYEVFRIGGDEFAVIAVGEDEAQLIQQLQQVNQYDQTLAVTFSYGYSPVNFSENNAVENAFVRADAYMYKHKNSKKQ